MNSIDIINKLINQGVICFNPYTMSVNPHRYSYPLSNGRQYDIQNNDIKELMTNLIITAETDCPYEIFSRYKYNAFLDIYALDTFAEVSWELSFPTLQHLRIIKKELGLETLYYYDNKQQIAKEL
jgi:hypothetical protein